MTQSTTRRGNRLAAELEARGCAPGPRPAAAGTAAATRRDFLGQAAGIGLALGMPPLLASCGDDADDAAQPPPRPAIERRTLFFDLSHEDYERTRHFIVAGGQRRELTKVGDAPEVLARERLTNGFLRAVPDDHITHHVEDLELASEICTLAYVGCGEDRASGRWQMSSVVQLLPTHSAADAYARAQARSPGGLAPSAKRALHGQAAAASAQDLVDESALVDSTDHARTLIGLHPDLLCAEPGGAWHIHTSHIQPNSRTRFLAAVLRRQGPASPQLAPNRPNPTGWATLLPLAQDDGTPFRNSRGLNQYLPDWSSGVDGQVAAGVDSIHRSVKDDETLGADVTGIAPPTLTPIAALAGKVWHRADGMATVQHAASAATAGDAVAPGWDFAAKTSYMGLILPTPAIEPPDASGAVRVTLTNITNWFLRFLGVWAQFYDANDQPISLANLPPGTIVNRDNASADLDKEYTALLALLPPPYTLAGIPIAPGLVSPALLLPKSVHTVAFQFAGLGFNGSWDDPDGIIPLGAVFTGLINWAVVALFMAVGVSTLGPAVKSIVPLASSIAASLVAYVTAAFDFKTQPSAAQIVALLGRLLLSILNGLAGKGVTQLVAVLATYMATAEIIDAVPIVGQIARAVAAVIGGVSLAESLVEVGISAPISRFDLVGTHDLGFTVRGDPNHSGQFPQLAAGYTLYYKVTYQFDSGTAHTKDGVDVPDPTVTAIPITLPKLPRGGQVKVSIGFYARSAGTPAGQNDWCAARGESQLQDNTQDTLADVTVTQAKIPILPSTRYVHSSRVALDAQGRHRWVTDADGSHAPGYVPPSGREQPGELGALRGITVRQGTAGHRGYLGYAWQAYSAGLLDCTSRAPGQLDHLANLGTDAANDGSNAEIGYARAPCGLQGGGTSGVRVAYNLLGDDRLNLYLDTGTLHVRPVSLADPPGFSPPGGGQSLGRLNLDSTRLLLHPAGHLMSISNASHKIETLRLPAAPLTDAQVERSHLARTASGQGSRPGLITSPVAMAISPDGVVLVLEDSGTNNRLQAFDVGGNPVPYFTRQKPAYFLPARRHRRPHLPRPRGRVHRLRLRAVAQPRRLGFPARHLPPVAARPAADLHHLRHQCRQDRGRLLAQRLHAELRSDEAARRHAAGDHRALGQPVAADPAVTGGARPAPGGADRGGDAWDAARYLRHSSLQEAMAAAALARIDLRGDERVLDVGCGDGRITARIAAQRVPRGRVLGIDASAGMIDFARRQHAAVANLDFALADAARLAFDAQFDAVVSFNALHWLADPAPALRGIRAALVAGGRGWLRLVTRGPATSFEEAAEQLRRSAPWAAHFEGFRDPYLRLSPDEVAAAAGSAGLRVRACDTRREAWDFGSRQAFAGFARAGSGAWTVRLPAQLRDAFVEAVLDAWLGSSPTVRQRRCSATTRPTWKWCATRHPDARAFDSAARDNRRGGAARSRLHPHMTELILIRHGETDFNREGRFQGHVDVPLNARGIGRPRGLARSWPASRASTHCSAATCCARSRRQRRRPRRWRSRRWPTASCASSISASSRGSPSPRSASTTPGRSSAGRASTRATRCPAAKSRTTSTRAPSPPSATSPRATPAAGASPSSPMAACSTWSGARCTACRSTARAPA